MNNTEHAGWRKSTYSGSNGGACVEVGHAPGSVAVRDTTDREGPALVLTPECWRAFTASVKTVL